MKTTPSHMSALNPLPLPIAGRCRPQQAPCTRPQRYDVLRQKDRFEHFFTNCQRHDYAEKADSRIEILSPVRLRTEQTGDLCNNLCEPGMCGQVTELHRDSDGKFSSATVKVLEDGETFEMVTMPLRELDFLSQKVWLSSKSYTRPKFAAGVDPRLEMFGRVRLKIDAPSYIQRDICEAGMIGCIVDFFKDPSGDWCAADVEVFEDGATVGLVTVSLLDVDFVSGA